MGGGNNPEADGQFPNAPIFNFNDGDLKFDTNDVANPNDNYGSSSGFSSKSLFRANASITRRFAYPRLLWT